MIFNPEKYSIPDEPGVPFIDPHEINQYLSRERSDTVRIKEIVEKAVGKNRLNLSDVAWLIHADNPEQANQHPAPSTLLKLPPGAPFHS